MRRAFGGFCDAPRFEGFFGGRFFGGEGGAGGGESDSVELEGGLRSMGEGENILDGGGWGEGGREVPMGFRSDWREDMGWVGWSLG